MSPWRAHRDVIAANRRAQELGEQLRLIMDRTPSAIFMIGRDGRLTRVNEAATDVTGYQPAELIGLPFTELWEDDDRAAIAESLSQLTKKGRCLKHPEAHLRRKDGARRPLDLSLRAIGDDDGPSGFLATAAVSAEAALVCAAATGPSAARHRGAGPRTAGAGRRGSPGPARREQRKYRRRRMFKGGKVSFHNGNSVVDCVVRDLSESGAKLEFESYFDCPRFVRLHITGGEVYDCEVSRFTNEVMGARFLKRVTA
jgi:PAS domain S-box-containing protein